jgi:hypothetical protein
MGYAEESRAKNNSLFPLHHYLESLPWGRHYSRHQELSSAQKIEYVRDDEHLVGGEKKAGGRMGSVRRLHLNRRIKKGLTMKLTLKKDWKEVGVNHVEVRSRRAGRWLSVVSQGCHNSCPSSLWKRGPHGIYLAYCLQEKWTKRSRTFLTLNENIPQLSPCYMHSYVITWSLLALF